MLEKTLVKSLQVQRMGNSQDLQFSPSWFSEARGSGGCRLIFACDTAAAPAMTKGFENGGIPGYIHKMSKRLKPQVLLSSNEKCS